jgi:hypothetical protein
MGILALRVSLMLTGDLMPGSRSRRKNGRCRVPGTERVVIIVMNNKTPGEKVIKVYTICEEPDGNQAGRYEEEQRPSRNKSIHPETWAGSESARIYEFLAPGTNQQQRAHSQGSLIAGEKIMPEIARSLRTQHGSQTLPGGSTRSGEWVDRT